MRRVLPALVLLIGATGDLEARVTRLVAELAAPTRSARLAAQSELAALPPEADPLLAAAVAPDGFEPRAALDYLRVHRPRPPRAIAIAAGNYRVGSDAPLDRNPRREVALAAFTIDETETTSFEWWRFVQATGAASPRGWLGGRFDYGAERRPVAGLSSDDAKRYAEWCGGRLPTSDEWEVAAHGGRATAFPWGDEEDGPFTLRVNLARGGAVPEVATNPDDRSPFGVVDLAGSLQEWVIAADGTPGVRGGYWRTGQHDLLRVTRAADTRAVRARDVVGFRIVGRR